MKLIGIACGFLVLGLGFYVYSMQVQSRDVAEFCATYAEGTLAEKFFTDAEQYSGQLMGGDKIADKARPQQFIYCAPTTMCDVSCSLEIVNGVVTKSKFNSL